jgi:hypothetical protein
MSVTLYYLHKPRVQLCCCFDPTDRVAHATPPSRLPCASPALVVCIRLTTRPHCRPFFFLVIIINNNNGISSSAWLLATTATPLAIRIDRCIGCYRLHACQILVTSRSPPDTICVLLLHHPIWRTTHASKVGVIIGWLQFCSPIEVH